MKKFIPSQIFVEKEALNYSLTYEILKKAENLNIPIIEDSFKKIQKIYPNKNFLHTPKGQLSLALTKTKN